MTGCALRARSARWMVVVVGRIELFRGMALRALNTVECGYWGSGIGNTVRSGTVCADAVAMQTTAKTKLIVAFKALRFIAFLLVRRFDSANPALRDQVPTSLFDVAAG